MHAYTVPSSGSTEVRWKRIVLYGAANTELSDVQYSLATRCSSLKFYLGLCRGAIQDSTYIHRVTEPAGKGCRSTTVVPVYVYDRSTNSSLSALQSFRF